VKATEIGVESENVRADGPAPARPL
jgi:hypothetical protein